MNLQLRYQCSVSGMADWLSSTVVYAQSWDSQVLGSNPVLHMTLALFLAISPVVKLLAKLKFSHTFSHTGKW